MSVIVSERIDFIARHRLISLTRLMSDNEFEEEEKTHLEYQ